MAVPAGVGVTIGTAFEEERFDLILDGVGSEVLSASIRAIAPGGTVVSYGRSASDGADPRPAEIPSTWYGSSRGAHVVGMVLPDELNRARSGLTDLRTLADLAQSGDLLIPIEHEVGWEDTGEMLQVIRKTGVIGKIALKISN